MYFAYRKRYSTQHNNIHLVKKWRAKVDNNLFVGAVLMDLPKAFDCVP